jgi:hypothetical protein
MAKSAKPPWKRSNPRKRAGKASKHLTPVAKAAAKASARRAGRKYPNLVDNMRMAAKAKTAQKNPATKKSVAKKAGRKTTSKKRATRKASAKKSAGRKSAAAGEKDPRGG